MMNKFRSFVHNDITLPLMVTGSEWSYKLHDWTADPLFGKEDE